MPTIKTEIRGNRADLKRLEKVVEKLYVKLEPICENMSERNTIPRKEEYYKLSDTENSIRQNGVTIMQIILDLDRLLNSIAIE